MGHEGDALRLPLSVANEDKSEELSSVLPVMGTPLKIRVERYLPDLKWETIAVEDPNGGAVARLSLRGERLNQDTWLSAREVARQGISSHIGGVTVRELPRGQASADVLQQVADQDAPGVLLVWLSDDEPPLRLAVKPGMRVELPGAAWKLSVPTYVPHYTIDRETRQVTSASDQPVNPAVEVCVEGQGREYRQWVWSKFPSSPHRRLQLPFRVQFVDLHPGTGQYVLVLTPGMKPRLVRREKEKTYVEQIELGARRPFGDKRYSFAVEEVRYGAAIETRWTNASDVLLHPAVVATIGSQDDAEQAVLELNKPYHHKTKLGTLVVLYRRVP
jgi:hypothetical protein